MRDLDFLESDWDVCIVLDACRYDVFTEIYDDYLEGDLEKRRSPGSSTPEWAYRTFTDSHDLAYFSGNPFINDLGISLHELKWGASCDYRWTANDHIAEVVDVWNHGWDDDLGTVPPSALARAYRERRSLVDRHERTVLHYMQPHAPYLSRGSGQKLKRIQRGIRRQGEQDANGDGGGSGSVMDVIRPKVEGVLDGNRFVQKLGLWLELDTKSVVRNGTRDTGLQLHRENLRLVLEEIARLIPDLDGRVVVTADHGEAFGENGVWEHHIETHIPSLVEVPWLEIPSSTH